MARAPKKAAKPPQAPAGAPGRPTLYTPELANTILDLLSEGTPLAEICRADGMPKVRTVSDWKTAHEDFGKAFLDARDAGFDAIAGRTRLTARGKTEAQGGDSQSDVQRDKLIIETDLKLLAKWDPRRYGDKLAVGGDPDGQPVRHEYTWLPAQD